MEIIRLDELTQNQVEILQALLTDAFAGDFSESDWQNSLGGARFVGLQNEELVAHGTVVARSMWLDESPITVGYVEAIAVAPNKQKQGIGSLLLNEITQLCLQNYELAMLSTDEKDFYRRFGWQDFPGQSFVLVGDQQIRTAEEDCGLMVLTPESRSFGKISKVCCQARFGDAW
jgi:aminoglycoside 2'-N-acetyltransferase I